MSEDSELDIKFDLEFWRKLWNKSDVTWQKECVHEKLVKFADKLLISGVDQHKVFVPLCGKTVDMKWLLDKGCRVVGVDCALSALEEFMVENRISHTRRKVGDAEVLESQDKRLALWCCDLFDFAQVSGERDFNAIWDRGSFVAVNFSQREQYVDLMKSLLASDFGYLLVWCTYDNRRYGGHPKSSSQDEIEGLFGKHFCVTTLLLEWTEMLSTSEALMHVLQHYTFMSPKAEVERIAGNL